MSGTKEGGLLAAETNKKRYGKSYYEDIGRKGGLISKGFGFKFGSELAKAAGRKGGAISRRGKSK